MASAAGISDGFHVGGLVLAGVLHDSMCDRAVARAEAKAAAGDVRSARALARAVLAERARADRLQRELSEMRARALRAEGALIRKARGA